MIYICCLNTVIRVLDKFWTSSAAHHLTAGRARNGSSSRQPCQTAQALHSRNAFLVLPAASASSQLSLSASHHSHNCSTCHFLKVAAVTCLLVFLQLVEPETEVPLANRVRLDILPTLWCSKAHVKHMVCWTAALSDQSSKWAANLTTCVANG